MYALNLAPDGRVLSVTPAAYASADQPRVDALPEGDVSDYRYAEGAFIRDPLPAQTATETPTQAEINAAEIDYLAMMTGVEL